MLLVKIMLCLTKIIGLNANFTGGWVVRIFLKKGRDFEKGGVKSRYHIWQHILFLKKTQKSGNLGPSLNMSKRRKTIVTIVNIK